MCLRQDVRQKIIGGQKLKKLRDRSIGNDQIIAGIVLKRMAVCRRAKNIQGTGGSKAEKGQDFLDDSTHE